MRRFLSGAAALIVAASLCSVISLARSVQPAGATALPTAALTSQGYWTFGANARVAAFGSTGYGASNPNNRLNGHIVGGTATSSGRGYWMVGTDGGVFSYGDAQFYGSTGNIHLNRPVVGMTATPDNRGYWFVASDGGVFAYGDAAFMGSMGGQKLNQPIVGMAATPSGGGYWLVASDGGIFAYGDARFYGSTGSIKLNKPIVGIATTPSGGGYWMVASDGGIFSFGDSKFYGSAGAEHLSSPIVGMATTPSGGGYWMVAGDGGVFTYGDSQYAGNAVSSDNGGSVVGIAAVQRHRTSETSIFYYPWYSSVPHDGSWRHWDQGGNTPPNYIGSDYWPEAGPYSSADAAVTTAQMQQIKNAGINTVIISWWGQGSWEDSTLATLIPEAQAAGLRIAAHIEPYGGRTAASVGTDETYLQGRGINEFYIYQADSMSQAGLQTDNDALGASVRVFAEAGNFASMRNGNFESWAAGAHFTGVYSYAGFGYSANDFNAICDSAHADHILCSDSVAPGFSGLRATSIKTVVGRANGATYDNSWQASINAGSDIVSITSYNEWHEGTQIEPAIPNATAQLSYQGAYGDTADDARGAYLNRTSMWTTAYASRYAPAFG